jgi:hypothetical protein
MPYGRQAEEKRKQMQLTSQILLLMSEKSPSYAQRSLASHRSLVPSDMRFSHFSPTDSITVPVTTPAYSRNVILSKYST